MSHILFATPDREVQLSGAERHHMSCVVTQVAHSGSPASSTPHYARYTGELDFGTLLNTALLLGSNPVKLLARIHGQCEPHGYFLQQDYQFVAEVIQEGLEIGLYRDGMGWGEVLTLFQTAGDPIVMSYSVCPTFPEGPPTDEEYEVWSKIPPETRWIHGFIELSRREDLRIQEHDFTRGYSFYEGKTLLKDNSTIGNK